jgi:4-hydroxymandelate oxidase
MTSVDDYAQAARAQLPADIWHYLSEGDQAANCQALASVPLVPRPLQNVKNGSSRTIFEGQNWEHPILLAPVAYQTLFHPQGEMASAMAAAAQGGQCIVSSLASQPLHDIASAAAQAGGPPPWFQLYWQGDRAHTARLLHKAVDAGYSAVVFTVDAPVKRASLQLPPGVRAVNLEREAAPHNGDTIAPNNVFTNWMAQAPTWDDLRWLRSQTTLPLLIKGVMHPSDAQHALDCGCDGLIVSNHGGRVLHGTPPSLLALERIVEKVGPNANVLFDSGIRSGRDVFAALACGAKAVLVGRPYVWGLAAHGALGVAQVIRLLRDELEMTMALTGCACVEDIAASRFT